MCIRDRYNAWDAISIGPDLPLAQLHPQPGLCPWVPGLRAFPKFDLTRDLFICKVATLVQIPATVPQTSLVASKGSTHGKEARSESITGIASSEVEIKVASNEPIGIIPVSYTHLAISSLIAIITRPLIMLIYVL